MYCVYPGTENDEWMLYLCEGGDFLVIAWFTTREDAEFACEAFEKRTKASAPMVEGCA